VPRRSPIPGEAALVAKTVLAQAPAQISRELPAQGMSQLSAAPLLPYWLPQKHQEPYRVAAYGKL